MSKDALAFLEAAKLVIASEPDEMRLIPRFLGPLYYLMCQAIELSMKSYLRSRGWDDKRLQTIRHDLQELLATAQAEQLATSPDFRLVVEWMHPYHLNHTFRYHKGGRFIQVPLPNEMVRMIEPQIQSCASEVNVTVRAHLRTRATRE